MLRTLAPIYHPNKSTSRGGSAFPSNSLNHEYPARLKHVSDISTTPEDCQAAVLKRWGWRNQVNSARLACYRVTFGFLLKHSLEEKPKLMVALVKKVFPQAIDQCLCFASKVIYRFFIQSLDHCRLLLMLLEARPIDGLFEFTFNLDSLSFDFAKNLTFFASLHICIYANKKKHNGPLFPSVRLSSRSFSSTTEPFSTQIWGFVPYGPASPQFQHQFEMPFACSFSSTIEPIWIKFKGAVLSDLKAPQIIPKYPLSPWSLVPLIL